MKKIMQWLEENGIEYKVNNYGNPYYFNDGFSVAGIQVTFYFDGIGNSMEKEGLLLQYIGKKKSYECAPSRFGAGYTYRIMTVFDSRRLADHEVRVQVAAEKYWEEEHRRRITVAEKIA